MTRDEFREAVFERDNFLCVKCFAPAVDAHHLIERRLWPDGGYHLDNGVSLCSVHHLQAESTELSATELRKLAGIHKVTLPDTLEDDHEYDKWGNIILPDGHRMRGPLFYDESVQKIIAPYLGKFHQYVKYPRTPHLPWSLGRSKDDMVLPDAPFDPEEIVVVTEKLDGENTTMYADHIHARSLEGGYHWSRTWVKNFWANSISYQIPTGMRIVGENMAATHSIKYDNLKSYFYGFGIWQDNVCLSWDETLENFDILGITPVPVIAHTRFGDLDEFFQTWQDDDREGYVVRKSGSFILSDFQKSVAKYVRADHVTNRTHWRVGSIDKNRMMM